MAGGTRMTDPPTRKYAASCGNTVAHRRSGGLGGSNRNPSIYMRTYTCTQGGKVMFPYTRKIQKHPPDPPDPPSGSVSAGHSVAAAGGSKLLIPPLTV